MNISIQWWRWVMDISNLSVANAVKNNYVKWCGDGAAYTSVWCILTRLIDAQRECFGKCCWAGIWRAHKKTTFSVEILFWMNWRTSSELFLFHLVLQRVHHTDTNTRIHEYEPHLFYFHLLTFTCSTTYRLGYCTVYVNKMENST